MPVWKRRAHAALNGETLESRQLLAFDSLVISEFMAANDSGAMDEDGDFSDWIEIHNPTNRVVSLDQWALTDDADDLGKWNLPAGQLAPHGYQLVFASGKNRTEPDGPLHTNFRLSADGEFLGLVDPQGTLVHSFGDAYPSQIDDVSYGLGIDQQEFLSIESGGRWRVPEATDAPLGDRWTALDFDDSAWMSSSGGLGYDLRPGFPNVGFESGDLAEWTTSGTAQAVTAAIGSPPTQGEWQASLVATGTSITRFQLEIFLGLSRGDLNSVGDVMVTRGSAMKRTFAFDAGETVELDWRFLTNEPLLDGAKDFAFVSISPGNHVFPLASVTDALQLSGTSMERETDIQTFSYTFDESGDYVIGLGVVNDASPFLDSALLVDNVLVGGIGSLEDTFAPFIKTDIGAALADTASSLWYRQPFEVTDPGRFESLELGLRFDDAAAVYLNGAPILLENLPDDVFWNSLATRDRDDNATAAQERHVIDSSHLRDGQNLLAVQVLKSSGSDPNFVLQTQLVGLGMLAEVPTFLESPTPASANVSRSFEIADGVQFGMPHGFYDQPFELVLTTPTLGASIRYTLDGSVPTLTDSILYEGPILIDTTQTVRAAAFRDDLNPSASVTQSYIFIEGVITQDDATAATRGFPDSWGEYELGAFPVDYELDRRIAGQNGTDLFNGTYAETIRDDLRSLPSLSLVMDFDDLFGEAGIYSHPFDRGVDWERPTSVELIYPDGREGFQANAGIRIQGGISRFISSKMSLRLLFKDDYGPAKLEFPFFGSDAGSTFDSISLRSSSGEHLVGIHYIRDEFVRRSQLMTENLSSHGQYMHLYINGLYWGMYNPVERIDGQFAANYLGGEKEDYDVLNAGDLGNEGISVVAGSLDAWNTLTTLASDVSAARTQEEKTSLYLRLQGLNPDGTPNPQLESFLDVDNYIDYLITQVYARNSDWPIRNYSMIRRRGPDSAGFKFLVWDAEFTIDRGSRTAVTSISRDGPGIIYRLLDTSEAFRVDFSDRAQIHFSPGGAYYVNPENRTYDPQRPEDNVPASLYASLVDEVAAALGPEAARWGDEQARSGRLFVPDVEWAQTVAANLNLFFPNRSRDLLANLRQNEFYRDAPTMSLPGGLVQPGQQVDFDSGAGTVFYTTDGTDPRRPDGSVSDSALPFTDPIQIESRTAIHARRLDGTKWSAIRAETYYTDAVPAGPHSLRISEINYNPHDALVSLGEPDLDNDEFEFIELVNVSNASVELSGVSLTQIDGEGVEFSFGQQVLPAGERVVVGRNRDALISRFGDALPLAVGAGSDVRQWVYQGRLRNSGETITIQAADGTVIERFTYNDQGERLSRADGAGSSLELVDLASDPTDLMNYRPSRRVGGSPGDAGAESSDSVVINEVFTHPGAQGSDKIELLNVSSEVVDMSGWYLTDSNDQLTRFSIPPNTILMPSDHAVFDESEFGFGLSGTRGDSLILMSSDSRGRPHQFVDEVHFGAAELGVSLGRWPEGEGRLFPMDEPSLGTANTGPRLGDVLMSEVAYHPVDPDGGGPLTDTTFEFVELYNRGEQPVDLTGWRIEGDVQFVFPPDTTLMPQQTLVVSRFDPARNPNLVFAFVLTFAADHDVKLIGPMQGNLSNAQGRLQLDKPVITVPGQDPAGWVLVDRMDYGSTDPWPSDLNATGRSLQRLNDSAFAGFAPSWIGRLANPGNVEFVDFRPGDVTQDGQVDVHDINHLCSSLPGGAQLARLDINGDGKVDVADFNELVVNILQTQAGDANLDGVFDSSDLVMVLAASEYEDGIAINSTWAEGDWNCDGEFESSDLVVALQHGDFASAASPASFGGVSLETVLMSRPAAGRADVDFGEFNAPKQEFLPGRIPMKDRPELVIRRLAYVSARDQLFAEWRPAAVQEVEQAEGDHPFWIEPMGQSDSH